MSDTLNKLILGDIEVNTINGKRFLEKKFKKSDIVGGIITISLEELGLIEKPVFLTCKYNDEIIYPDITWISENLELDFGFDLDETDEIKIFYI